MNLINENGEPVYLFDGREPDGTPATFGILKRHATTRARRGNLVRMMQLFTLIETGLPVCQLFFQGLRRRCLAGNDPQASETKRILVLDAHQDFELRLENRFDGPNALEEIAPPADKVFVVIASPNGHKNLYPSVDYWLEHWTWVDCHPTDPTKPKDFHLRYDRQLP